jgi:peroxiredoxin Q/BCP
MSINHIRNCVLALLSGFLIAVARGATAPTVGQIAPDFTLDDLDACSVQLSDLTSKGGVVLVVLRGWPGYQCPLCNQQAHNFAKTAEKFKAAGAHVVMVYPGPADDLKAHAKDFLSDKNWPKNFDLVLDPDYSFTRAYGLRWDAPSETAYPSTFVIAKGGKITFSHISHQHGDRVEAETILKLLSVPVNDSQAK